MAVKQIASTGDVHRNPPRIVHLFGEQIIRLVRRAHFDLSAGANLAERFHVAERLRPNVAGTCEPGLIPFGEASIGFSENNI
jgi:hypothetical protein